MSFPQSWHRGPSVVLAPKWKGTWCSGQDVGEGIVVDGVMERRELRGRQIGLIGNIAVIHTLEFLLMCWRFFEQFRL